MAKKPSEAALRAQKDAQRKKLLLILIVPFIALLAWQGPKTFKALQGGSPPPPPTSAVPATPTTSLPTGTPTVPGTGFDQGGVLPDTDLQPDLLDGQLLSFSRFSGRDPFVRVNSSNSGQSQGEGATIEVNGTSEDVGINDPFPASDPTFRLVSVTDTAAVIGLVSGSFSNGDDTVTINVGETLVLAADDGARYAIKIVSVAS
jgi:hypothetical protein